MSEENRRIALGLGDVSDRSELGVYYIDMRPARVHYRPNIWGGGFDEQGVPTIAAPEGPVHSPVNIAQYGFILHADWLTSRDAGILGTLHACTAVMNRLATETPQGLVWWHQHPDLKYGIHAPWASSMAQGEAISFYLRMFQITGDDTLLSRAREAARFLSIDVVQGGVRRLDANGDLWFEEYPSSEPSFVLNGFIYTMFGLWDLWRVTREEPYRADFNRCVATLQRNLHKYDVGYWSLYDQLKGELVRYYYQKNVHVPQMAVLHQLTGIGIFEEYRARWARQITPVNFLLVQIMYRVRPRIRRLKALFS